MMIDPGAWHWPQYVYIAAAFIGLLATAVVHGKPMLEDGQPRRYNFMVKLVQIAFMLFILIFGGFFA